MSKVLQGSSENFSELVLQSNKPVLLVFWAPWCTPCRMVAPLFDAISEERSDVQVVKVNSDTSTDLVEKCQVTALPYLCFFQHGKLEASHRGVMSESSLNAWIDQHIQ